MLNTTETLCISQDSLTNTLFPILSNLGMLLLGLVLPKPDLRNISNNLQTIVSRRRLTGSAANGPTTTS